MTLECYASGGNPDEYQYTWMFVPKYGDANLTYNEQKLVLEKVYYKTAGNYLCKASNYGGFKVNSKEVQIICKFSQTNIFYR